MKIRHNVITRPSLPLFYGFSKQVSGALLTATAMQPAMTVARQNSIEQTSRRTAFQI